MKSANFSDFFPSPLCPHLDLIYTLKFKQTPLISPPPMRTSYLEAPLGKKQRRRMSVLPGTRDLSSPRGQRASELLPPPPGPLRQQLHHSLRRLPLRSKDQCGSFVIMIRRRLFFIRRNTFSLVSSTGADMAGSSSFSQAVIC